MFEFDKDKFGERLKKLIVEEGYTQNSFAEASGVSISSLRNYLDGKAEVKADSLCRMAETLGITIDNLIFEKPRSINPKPQDIIDSLNLLINAYGRDIVTYFKDSNNELYGYPVLQFDDEKICNYLDKIYECGNIKESLYDIGASDIYEQLLYSWADIDGCKFEHGIIYNPNTQQVAFNKKTNAYFLMKKDKQEQDLTIQPHSDVDDIPFKEVKNHA